MVQLLNNKENRDKIILPNMHFIFSKPRNVSIFRFRQFEIQTLNWNHFVFAKIEPLEGISQ